MQAATGGGGQQGPQQEQKSQQESLAPTSGVWPNDPCLTSVAKRLVKALICYYRRQPIKSGTITWSRFFSEVDSDNSGTLSFPELEQAVREKLRANISKYEMRVFWRRLDADSSGQATIVEFTRVMYIIELSTWPDLSKEELDRTVQTLSDAAEKWHRAGGNWFKIFSAIDFDDSGAVSYDELRQCIRSTPPGLRLKETELPERCIQGLWKLIDCEADIEVPVYRFMTFMRKHSSISMHRLTTYSLKKRGLEKAKELPPETPERSDVQLRAIFLELEAGLQEFYAKRGQHVHGSSEANWMRFFREMDADGSQRLKFPEFRDGLMRTLRKASQLGQDDMAAFWGLIDPDKSGEVSWKELSLALYKLEVSAWPDDEDAAMENVAAELSASLKKRLHAGGNWYKAFTIVDKEGTGHVRFAEFKELVRDSWQGLSIGLDKVPDKKLKAFWKRLDSNLSGDVSVAEFMIFMRRHGGNHGMHKLTEYSKKKRGLVAEPKDYSEEIASAPAFNEQAMGTVAMRLSLAVSSWLLSRGVRQNVGSPQVWAQFIGCIDSKQASRNGRIGFEEFMNAIRSILRLSPDDMSDDEIRAFWRKVDADCTGEATAAEFDRAVYRMQLDTWPKISDQAVNNIVAVLSSAAEKWHRAGGNWYKVFTSCDEDGSGNMGFQELHRIVRKGFPGLSIGASQVSENDLRGFWSALDADRSGLVSVREFMIFMRTHGKDFSMHKATAYALRMRGEYKEDPLVGEPPPRSRDELRAINTRLDEALVRYWRRKGVTGATSRVSAMWARLFNEAESVSAGRFTFFELERNLRVRFLSRAVAAATTSAADAATMSLETGGASGEAQGGEEAFSLHVEEDGGGSMEESVGHKKTGASATGSVPVLVAGGPGSQELIAKGVTRDDLHALWSLVIDIDGSGEVSAEDWRLRNYRLQLEVWPAAPENKLIKVVDTISAAADKWHRAGGNWYKVFNLCDTEGAGCMSFDVMLDIVRRPLPCLAIPTDQLSESDLKGLWKAMDVDQSGDVNVAEFMVFMRRLDVKRGVSHSPKAAVGSVVHRAKNMMKLGDGFNELSSEHRDLLCFRLADHSVDSFADAYNAWGLPWTGFVSEWDFHRVVRELLCVPEEQLDDLAVYSAWTSLSGSSDGFVQVETILDMGQ